MLQGNITDTEEKITQLGMRNSSAKLFPAGTVLISIFATIGRTAVLEVDATTNQAIAGLTPIDAQKLNPAYLRRYLDSIVATLEGKAQGVAQININSSILKSLPVPLPSLEYQERVIDILDHIDKLRAKRRAAITLLDDLARSIFIDLFGDPSRNPKGWPMKVIGDLLESASYGTSAKADLAGDLPVLRMNNVTITGSVDLANLKYMQRDSVSERYLVYAGDILFNRTNSPELVGKTAVYRGSDPLAYAGYLVRLRTNKENDPEYVSAFLNTGYAKRVLRNMCKSIVGMANINAREIQGVSIAQPPLKLQQKFAALTHKIESFRHIHRSHLAELDTLFAAVQHRAFRGELQNDLVEQSKP